VGEGRSAACSARTFECDDAGHAVVAACGDQFNALYRRLGV